jgi:type I restriction enzyme S subunit
LSKRASIGDGSGLLRTTQIPADWNVPRIGEMFSRRIERGRAGLPVMSITMAGGLVERDSVDRRVDSNLSPESHLLVRAGDLAYNMMRMWQGVLGRGMFDCLVSPAYIVLQPGEQVDPEFAEYLFSSKTAILEFKRLSYGVVDDRLRLYYRDLVRIPFAVPRSRVEQRRIAKVLSTLDETIEQTEALIAKYQQIKAGLMQDMFIRGVTPDGRLRPTHANAPHLYKESPLGWIPKEWGEKSLGECFTLQRGFDITQEQQSRGDVPVVSSSGITGFHSVAMCPGPGVVIGRKGKLGNAYYLKTRYWPHDTTLWVKDFHGNSVPFARHFLIWLRLDRFDASTSVPTLNRNFVHPLRVALPSPAEQEQMVMRLDAHGALLESAESELSKCRMLKQGLMHDLLTGRVRVKVTESEEVPA